MDADANASELRVRRQPDIDARVRDVRLAAEGASLFASGARQRDSQHTIEALTVAAVRHDRAVLVQKERAAIRGRLPDEIGVPQCRSAAGDKLLVLDPVDQIRARVE